MHALSSVKFRDILVYVVHLMKNYCKYYYNIIIFTCTTSLYYSDIVHGVILDCSMAGRLASVLCPADRLTMQWHWCSKQSFLAVRVHSLHRQGSLCETESARRPRRPYLPWLPAALPPPAAAEVVGGRAPNSRNGYKQSGRTSAHLCATDVRLR